MKIIVKNGYVDGQNIKVELDIITDDLNENREPVIVTVIASLPPNINDDTASMERFLSEQLKLFKAKKQSEAQIKVIIGVEYDESVLNDIAVIIPK